MPKRPTRLAQQRRPSAAKPRTRLRQIVVRSRVLGEIDGLGDLLAELPAQLRDFFAEHLLDARTRAALLRVDDRGKRKARVARSADRHIIDVRFRGLELFMAAVRATRRYLDFHDRSSCSVERAVDRGPAGSTQPVRTDPIVGRRASARK